MLSFATKAIFTLKNGPTSSSKGPINRASVEAPSTKLAFSTIKAKPLVQTWSKNLHTSSLLRFDDTDFAPRSRVRSKPATDWKDEDSGSSRFSSSDYASEGRSTYSSGGRGDRFSSGDRFGGLDRTRSSRSFDGPSSRSFDGPSSRSFDGPSSSGGYSRPGGLGGRFSGGAGGAGRSSDWGNRLVRRNFSEENLPPVVKDLHKEVEEIKNMPNEKVAEWRASHGMEIIGEGCPKPIFSFSQTSFPPFIQRHLTKLFPKGPSPVQSQGWALASCGRDMVASAETGSGKTLAFVLPALDHIAGQPKMEPGTPGADEPVALFLAPTRELAMQIHEETKKFSSFYGYKTACVFGGGQNRMEQSRQLLQKPQIVIATPGRLIDFVESKIVNLGRISYVVLDEADRMLDMGFEPQVRAILEQIRPDRQTLMWSATWPRRVKDLAHSFLKDPIRIRIGSDELSANKNVTQQFVFCDWHDRLDRLLDILKNRKGEKILIFTTTKVSADVLADELYDNGHRVQSLHGDKAQNVRSRILDDFKSGRASILIATDVAARGIDVSDINCVINYNMPKGIEDYVHRIGRTGRAGRKGTSISFFTGDDESLIPELIPILKESEQEIPTELAGFMERRRAQRAQILSGRGGSGGGGRRFSSSRSFSRPKY